MEVLDPSYFDNEHKGQFVVDLDREDAFLDVAWDRVDQLHVGDDIFADADALVSDVQAYAVGEEHALDASVAHTLDVVADDEEVLAFHPSQLHATYVGVLVDALAEKKVEAPYLVLDDILKSFHSVALREHYYHYLVVISCLFLRAVADVDLEELMDLVVHHSVVLANSLAVTLVAVVDIHLLSNFDYQYHFVNVPVVEMPLLNDTPLALDYLEIKYFL